MTPDINPVQITLVVQIQYDPVAEPFNALFLSVLALSVCMCVCVPVCVQWLTLCVTYGKYILKK